MPGVLLFSEETFPAANFDFPFRQARSSDFDRPVPGKHILPDYLRQDGAGGNLVAGLATNLVSGVVGVAGPGEHGIRQVLDGVTRLLSDGVAIDHSGHFELRPGALGDLLAGVALDVAGRGNVFVTSAAFGGGDGAVRGGGAGGAGFGGGRVASRASRLARPPCGAVGGPPCRADPAPGDRGPPFARGRRNTALAANPTAQVPSSLRAQAYSKVLIRPTPGGRSACRRFRHRAGAAGSPPLGVRRGLPGRTRARGVGFGRGGASRGRAPGRSFGGTPSLSRTAGPGRRRGPPAAGRRSAGWPGGRCSKRPSWRTMEMAALVRQARLRGRLPTRARQRSSSQVKSRT